ALSCSATVSTTSSDPVPGNNSPPPATATATVQSDIAISIATSPASQTSAELGANIVYVISIVNNGPSTATGISFASNTTTNMTFVTISNTSTPPGSTFS